MANNGSTIGTAYVQIIPSTDGIGKTIEKEFEGAGEESGKKFGSSFSSTAGGVLKTTGKVIGFTAAATTGLATSIYGMATKSAQAADNIDKMSQKLGLSRKGFQELDFVLSQSGVDINSFGGGAKSLLANMDKVNEGNETATKNFEALGVAVLDANGKMRSQEEVLFDTVRAFQNMEDGAEKSRLAQELFGKQGQELIPLLNSEAGSFDDLRKQANKLGMVLGDDLIDDGVKLTDTLDKTKRTITGLVTQIAANAMPIVQSALDFIIENLPKIQGFIDELAPIVMDALEKIAPVLADLGQKLIPVIAETIATILPIVVDLISTVMPIIANIISAVLPALVAVIKGIRDAVIELRDKFIGAWEKIKETWDKASDFFSGLVKIIKDKIGDMIQAGKDIINGLLKGLKAMWGEVESWVKSKVDWISNMFGLAGHTLADKLNPNTIVSKAQSSVMNKVTVKAAVISGKNGMPSNIPKMASGGIVEHATLAEIGEAGTEAVIPLENNSGFLRALANDISEASNSKSDTSILEDIRAELASLRNLTVVMDTGATVGALASPMDNALGKIASRRERFA